MIYITTYPLPQRINPMRKLLLTTAAVAAAIGLAGCGSGTFTDERDRQKYRTVEIGGKRWMAQNLNYKTESGSWCYDNKADSCKKYGRLYDWKTAKIVCPKGWKLPSREDWGSLTATMGGGKVAGKRLKAKSGWNENGNGTDDFGFSALPGGLRYSVGYFGYAGYRGRWWTATEYSGGYAYFRFMFYNFDIVYEFNFDKSFGFSARCVADRP